MSVSIIIFLFATTTCISLSTQEVVKVSLYYESKCPACHEFILDQLVPGYAVLGDYVNLNLVPYGKCNRTMVDGKLNVKCQHGNNECIGNRIQGCALNTATTQKDGLAFVHCMTINHPENLNKAKKCAKKSNLKWESIESCINSKLGDDIVNRLGDETQTLKPRLVGIPHIRINDKFDEDIEYDVIVDFMKLCTVFHEKPNVCP